MATVTGSGGGIDNDFSSSDLMALTSAALGTHNATAFTLTIPGQIVLTGTGTGFSYSGNHPTAGTITSLTLQMGTGTATWTNFSVSASTLWHAISTGDTASFNSLFFGGDDVFNLQGDTGPDFLSGGAGNDTFNFGASYNDASQVDGGSGNDVVNLDGDYGYVTLGYMTSIETVKLADGHFYNLGAHPIANQTIDATALNAGFSVVEDTLFINSGAVTLLGGASNDTLVGGKGNDVFDGGAGSDTIDYSRATGGVTVNLSITTGQSVGGGEGTDTLRNVENITGSQYNDTLTGNSGDNIFFASGGHDTIVGGGGSDTVSFQNQSAGLTFDLRSSPQNVGGDTISGVANIIGTPYGDTFIGDSSNNHFIGGGHNGVPDVTDYSHASGGMVITETSVVYTTYLSTTFVATGGGQGTDTLTDMSEIVGSNGADTFNLIDPGNIYLDGGAGNDTLSFQGATTGVNVNLGDGGGMSTSFVSIETLVGSNYTDNLEAGHTSVVIHGGGGDDTISGAYGFDGTPGSTFYGDDGNDTIYGTTRGANGNGNDVIYGGAGDDHLYSNQFNGSSGGDDIFDGGTGDDTIVGGDGQNTVTYQDATGGVTVNLSQEDAYYKLTADVGGGMGTDTLQYIQNLTGSDYADRLTGNEFDNTLDGGKGNDTLDISQKTGNNPFGPPGTGEDTVLGGLGNDTIIAGNDLDAGDKIDGGAGNDTVTIGGDAYAAFTFAATTMVNVETLKLAAGNSYGLTTDDATVAAGANLGVDGSALGAGDVLTFDGSHETDGSFTVNGGAGNDVLRGGKGNYTINGNSGNDTINGALGSDTINGGDGDDTINVAADLDAMDKINGGAGNDTVALNGNYSAGLTLTGTMLAGVESIKALGAFNYNLTTADSLVATGRVLNVDASALGAANHFVFDGSAETDGRFSFSDGAGNDTLKGGAQADVFTVTHGGNDTVAGGAGDDVISLGGTFDANDAIDGGAGKDTLVLDGDYSGGVAFRNLTLANVEVMRLTTGHSYDFTTNFYNVAGGTSLTVDGTALGAADTETFDGSAAKSGAFILKGGQGNDVLTGGAHNDIIIGGLGADHLAGSGGADRFVYKSAAESTGTGFDTLSDFDAASDLVDLPFKVAHINTAVTVGALSAATFDADLAAAIGHGQLGTHHAVLFTASTGDFAGDTFLIVDMNKVAGYQAGQDLVVMLDHPANIASFGVADFV